MNKKKILAVGLVACMTCGILAGCGGGDDKKPATNDGKIQKEQVETKADRETNTNKGDNQSTEDVYEGFEITEANKHLGDVVNYARATTDVDTYKPILSKDQKDADKAFEVLGLTDTDMEEFAISIDATNENAYAVAIVKPAESKEESVKAGLQGYIEAKKQAVDTEDTAETDLVNAASIETIGDYTVLVMCKDHDEVVSKITDGINNPTVVESYLNEIGGTSNTEDSFLDKNAETNSSDTNESNTTDADLNNQIVPADDGAIESEVNTVAPADNGASDTSDTWQ